MVITQSYLALTLYYHLQRNNNAGRKVKYRVEFPDPENCPSAPDSHGPGSTEVQIERGSTALDVMSVAADKDSKFNFKSTYFGGSGYFVNAIGGTAKSASCFWAFYYKVAEIKDEKKSSLGVSNVVIPGDDWEVIMKFEQIKNKTKDLINVYE